MRLFSRNVPTSADPEVLWLALSVAEIVDWAEASLLDSKFDEKDSGLLREVLSRLALADVSALGVLWEDCEDMQPELGFTVHLNI